ncbi:hypothetical protein PM10SUCC1_36280 [Propionigenium maris DSM 9537]|uniref:Uncharacterized protein n=1 Tax=Propionigenium maris DSM 9537 TaxID=1123000 RepID=A0A9W6LPK5_9FUSO|nr:hypothetical protein [Propionigenium maris]GLI58114.1 hypothetical protein PM10SUCC1_36280 [Propionigenium maris DSM 9537]
MLRDNVHKSHHYYLRDNFIQGEKWMDTKGIIWTIDDISDNYMVVESVVDDKIAIRKIEPRDYSEFLHHKMEGKTN